MTVEFRSGATRGSRDSGSLDPILSQKLKRKKGIYIFSKILNPLLLGNGPVVTAPAWDEGVWYRANPRPEREWPLEK